MSTNEPTLTDVMQTMNLVLSRLDTIGADVKNLKTDVNTLKTDVNTLKTDVARYDEKFDNYQKGIQWVVQLAFSLIAGATVTVIVSAVVTLLVRR